MGEIRLKLPADAIVMQHVAPSNCLSGQQQRPVAAQPAQPRTVHCVDAHINDGGALLHPVALHHLRLAARGDDDVSLGGGEQTATNEPADTCGRPASWE